MLPPGVPTVLQVSQFSLERVATPVERLVRVGDKSDLIALLDGVIDEALVAGPVPPARAPERQVQRVEPELAHIGVNATGVAARSLLALTGYRDDALAELSRTRLRHGRHPPSEAATSQIDVNQSLGRPGCPVLPIVAALLGRDERAVGPTGKRAAYNR